MAPQKTIVTPRPYENVHVVSIRVKLNVSNVLDKSGTIGEIKRNTFPEQTEFSRKIERKKRLFVFEKM